MNLFSPVKLLVCALVCYFSIVVAKSHKPEQVRLQLTGVPGEVVITYTTGSSANPDTAHPSDPAKIPRTFCSYGLKDTKDMSMVEGTHHRFAEELYQADIHQCVLTKLTAGAEYVYQVGDESKEDGLSDFFTFTAGVPKRWAVYGGKLSICSSLVNLHPSLYLQSTLLDSLSLSCPQTMVPSLSTSR